MCYFKEGVTSVGMTSEQALDSSEGASLADVWECFRQKRPPTRGPWEGTLRADSGEQQELREAAVQLSEWRLEAGGGEVVADHEEESGFYSGGTEEPLGSMEQGSGLILYFQKITLPVHDK